MQFVQFVRFSYYKTANRTAPCGVVRCGAILLAVQCSYAILRAVFATYAVLLTPLHKWVYFILRYSLGKLKGCLVW